MFVKKDLRKVPEILKDAVDKKEPCSNLHLSKRKAEFRGTIDIFKQQQQHEQQEDVLRSVESLSLYDCEIETVDGISECLPNLRDLCLGHNPISDLCDVGSLSNLKRLWMDDCKLSGIGGLAALGNLEELRLSNNAIAELPSTIGDDMPNLRVLSADHNAIEALPESLSRLSHLRILQVRQNRLRTLWPFEEVLPRSLTILHASSNQIKGVVDLSSLQERCPDLQLVYLNSNRITGIEQDGGGDSGNSSSSSSKNSKLRRLNLSNNDVDDIPESWKSRVDLNTGVCRLGGDDKNGGGSSDATMLDDDGKENGDGGNGPSVTTVLLDDNPIIEELQDRTMMDIELLS